MIKQKAVNTGHSAQFLRAMHREGYVPPAGSLVDDSSDNMF